MAEKAEDSSQNEEFQQGSEPGASRNSMLVATESYEAISHYLEAELKQTEVDTVEKRKLPIPKIVDSGGGASNNLNKDETCQNELNTDHENDTFEESSPSTGSQHEHTCEAEVPSNSPRTANAIENNLISENTVRAKSVTEVEPNLQDDSNSNEPVIEPDCDTDDISSVNKRLSSLSASDGSPRAVNTDPSEASEECSSEIISSSPTPEEVCPEFEYVHSAQWRNHEKHIFILSKAGKPIYCRHGDEDRLVTLFGVMQALVSFIQSSKDSIRYIVAGDHKFIFLVREHLILVAISRSQECHAHILLQLTYVYNQILSILTLSQLNRIFSNYHNYDLRRLLSGTEKTFDTLLNVMNRDASFFLGAVRCLPLEASVRDTIANSIAHNAKVKDLVFAIVIADHQLITLVRMKRYFLHPLDLHLIFNLVSASESFKTAESWIPICLPKFDSNGYLHAYVCYLDDSFHSCLLLLTVDKDLFFILADCKRKIMEKLTKHQSLKSVSDSVRRGNFTISQAGIPELRHFLYKSRSTAQFTTPRFEAPYTTEEDQQRIFRLYQHLHYRIHSSSRPLKIMYSVGEYETLLGWVTSGFELYCVFGPLVTKPLAINSINKLLKWIKKEEDKLFILNSPTF